MAYTPSTECKNGPFSCNGTYDNSLNWHPLTTIEWELTMFSTIATNKEFFHGRVTGEPANNSSVPAYGTISSTQIIFQRPALYR